MEKTTTSVDDHLASLPEGVREDMVALDRLVSEAMAGLPRVMWEGTFWGGSDQKIIGYGDLVQKRPKGDDVEWFHVGLAAQKINISLYVNLTEEGEYLGARYGDRLGKVKLGAASIGFRRLESINVAVLEEMLTRARELIDAG